jgi:hypothetical protein
MHRPPICQCPLSRSRNVTANMVTAQHLGIDAGILRLPGLLFDWGKDAFLGMKAGSNAYEERSGSERGGRSNPNVGRACVAARGAGAIRNATTRRLRQLRGGLRAAVAAPAVWRILRTVPACGADVWAWLHRWRQKRRTGLSAAFRRRTETESRQGPVCRVPNAPPRNDTAVHGIRWPIPHSAVAIVMPGGRC